MKWSLYTPDPYLFSTGEMYNLAQSSTEFFNDAMSASPDFAKQDIYLTTFDVKYQEVKASDVMSIINAEIIVLYAGKEIQDFSGTLATLLTNANADNLLKTLVSSGLFETSSTSSKIEFANVSSDLVASGSPDTTLFIVLISLVGVLMLASLVILLSSIGICGRKSRRRRENMQMEGIKPSNTMETAGNNSPGNSPVVGARRNEAPDDANSAYAMTPARGTNPHRAEMLFSPASETTEVSPSNMSAASRNPLGIMRLNTLNKISVGLNQAANNAPSMYNITLHETSYDEESNGTDKK